MALPRDIVAGLTRRLAERAGLELPAWVVEARATARMEALGVSAAEYVELVATPRGRVELDELVEAVRVGETRFFRHVSQVEALVDVVAPAIAARGRRNVRVWSAGCASGEEAYTLAIVLSRVLPEHSVTVIATDVSEDALAVAARGRYPRAALAHVPEEWRDAFEDVAGADGGEIRVRPELAKRVTFAQANLVEGDAPRGCQVVWCRNVLIYFASEARKRAVQKLLSALDTGGWLFVGYSEQLRNVVELEAVRAGDVTIYVKRGTGASLPTRTPVVGIPIQSQPSARSVTPMPVLVKPGASASASRKQVVARGDCGELGREIGEALKGVGLKQLEIDLDGAEVVPDEVAVTLRRAKAAAEAAGVVLVLRASRAGVKRWLTRVGLAQEQP